MSADSCCQGLDKFKSFENYFEGCQMGRGVGGRKDKKIASPHGRVNSGLTPSATDNVIMKGSPIKRRELSSEDVAS
jgi:hypothetical protein